MKLYLYKEGRLPTAVELHVYNESEQKDNRASTENIVVIVLSIRASIDKLDL